jgi:hypothetical protein
MGNSLEKFAIAYGKTRCPVHSFTDFSKTAFEEIEEMLRR